MADLRDTATVHLDFKSQATSTAATLGGQSWADFRRTSGQEKHGEVVELTSIGHWCEPTHLPQEQEELVTQQEAKGGIAGARDTSVSVSR